MIRGLRFIYKAVLPVVFVLFGTVSCKSVDDEKIPSMPVSINLSTLDMWVTYGVDAYGEYTEFIASLRQPRSFPFTDRTMTGFGGVLLVSGKNPYNNEIGPMAYDLACPVECKPDIRVVMRPDGLIPFAVCPQCGSKYDVVERGGTPVEGPAFSRKLGMRMYNCYQTQFGGYMISN